MSVFRTTSAHAGEQSKLRGARSVGRDPNEPKKPSELKRSYRTRIPPSAPFWMVTYLTDSQRTPEMDAMFQSGESDQKNAAKRGTRERETRRGHRPQGQSASTTQLGSKERTLWAIAFAE